MAELLSLFEAFYNTLFKWYSIREVSMRIIGFFGGMRVIDV